MADNYIPRDATGLDIVRVYKACNLGTASTDGTYDLGKLCSNMHGHTNMWAKYKPVSAVQLGEVPDSVRRNLLWGLLAPSRQNQGIGYHISEAFADPGTTAYERWMEGWSYQPPTGGSGSPYRISDWRGYLHDAHAPIDYIDMPRTYRQGDTIRFSVRTSAQRDGEISLSELYPNEPGQYQYLCLLLKVSQTGTVRYKAISAPSPLQHYTSGDTITIEFDPYDVAYGGDFEWVLCLSGIVYGSMTDITTYVNDATHLVLPVPCQYPEAMRGTCRFDSNALPAARLLNIPSIWGINCRMDWVPEHGLMSTTSNGTSANPVPFCQGGGIDYSSYHLQLGITVSNITTTAYVDVYLYTLRVFIDSTFGGGNVQVVPATVYQVSSADAGVPLTPTAIISIGAERPYKNLAPGESIHLVLLFDFEVMLAPYSSNTEAGVNLANKQITFSVDLYESFGQSVTLYCKGN